MSEGGCDGCDIRFKCKHYLGVKRTNEEHGLNLKPQKCEKFTKLVPGIKPKEWVIKGLFS